MWWVPGLTMSMLFQLAHKFLTNPAHPLKAKALILLQMFYVHYQRYKSYLPRPLKRNTLRWKSSNSQIRFIEPSRVSFTLANYSANILHAEKPCFLKKPLFWQILYTTNLLAWCGMWVEFHRSFGIKYLIGISSFQCLFILNWIFPVGSLGWILENIPQERYTIIKIRSIFTNL